MLERSRKGLFREALKVASKKGDEVQRIDVEVLIAETARSAGEYDDLTSGRRDPTAHAHHPIKDLLESVQEGKAELKKIIAEMEGRG